MPKQRQSVSLGVYWFCFYEARKRKDRFQLNKIRNQVDGIDIIEAYLNRKIPVKDLEESEWLRVSNVQRVGRRIDGIVRSGRFGRAGKLVDTLTDETVYDIKIQHGTTYPFYFQFFVPEGGTYGILIVQTIGQSGIFGCLDKDITGWIKGEYDGLMYDVEADVPVAIVRKLTENARVSEIHCTRLIHPPDLNDAAMREGEMNEVPTTIELSYSIKVTKGGSLKWKDWLTGSSPSFELLRVPMPSFEPESYQIEVDLGRSKRRVDVERMKLARPYFPIDPEFNEKTGHPVFEQVRAKADELREDFMALVEARSED